MLPGNIETSQESTKGNKRNTWYIRLSKNKEQAKDECTYGPRKKVKK